MVPSSRGSSIHSSIWRGSKNLFEQFYDIHSQGYNQMDSSLNFSNFQFSPIPVGRNSREPVWDAHVRKTFQWYATHIWKSIYVRHSLQWYSVGVVVWFGTINNTWRWQLEILSRSRLGKIRSKLKRNSSFDRRSPDNTGKLRQIPKSCSLSEFFFGVECVMSLRLTARWKGFVMRFRVLSFFFTLMRLLRGWQVPCRWSSNTRRSGIRRQSSPIVRWLFRRDLTLKEDQSIDEFYGAESSCSQ